MHTGIGTAGADDGDSVTGDHRQGRFEMLLNGGRTALRLPTGIGCAVILDTDRDARHETRISPG